MSKLSGIKPIANDAIEAEALHGEMMLKEFALGLLIANAQGVMVFTSDDLARIANEYQGIKIEPVESKYIGDQKMMIFSLIPKEPQGSLIIQ